MRKNGRLLIVAGSDSGGGAGIQADIKTCTALGGFAMTAVTALTAQNTEGVHGVHPVPPGFIADQMRVVLRDIGADAVKTGMLHDAEVIEAVAETLEREAPGARPSSSAAGWPSWAALGVKAVLLKDGHGEGAVVRDRLLEPSGETVFEHERLDTRHTHGTGCTLASAAATGLSQGLDLVAAMRRAGDFVHEAIRTAPGLGRGHGPLNHRPPV